MSKDGTEQIAVAKCPNCGYVYGEDLDYRFPNPSECLKCGAETENTTVADAETVRSLADDGLRPDGGTVEDGIDRPEVDVETLDHRSTETHTDSIEGEVTRDYWECPNPDCDAAICTWMDCPECLWYDEDVWERTLSDSPSPDPDDSTLTEYGGSA